MTKSTELLSELTQASQELFKKRRIIMSFAEYLDLLAQKPEALIRNSASYIRDTFDYFGKRPSEGVDPDIPRFKLFDIGTEKTGAVIGNEFVQYEIYKVLQNFVRQGQSNKLVLLHGPNGSSKSTTVDAVAHAMQRYSETEDGAVYRFCWVFPADRSSTSRMKGDTSQIGFSTAKYSELEDKGTSYAYLDEYQIASKIHSEYKDNPVFLIPMPQREVWLRQWIAQRNGVKPEDVEIPQHILLAGLSKRNQLIFENLLASYDGNLSKVFRHIQVERFFYSKQYRVGISTVEPQMSIDAVEKQLTMDKNIANLPTVLHNISFHEAQGELIEANRGMLEFSDLLKRPVETFKYLLNTVEKSYVSLPSSTANLDIVFVATTNEKHLDGFKTLPDFSSFRGRFELITVPYLLQATQECKIYESDIKAISKVKKVVPHSLHLLCVWAVMTRLKQPDPEYYDTSVRNLVGRLDPRTKLNLYEGKDLGAGFRPDEASQFVELRRRILNESNGLVVYEGRFGASPREIRTSLYRAAQSSRHKAFTPMAIFEELERLTKDRSVYEFLQFEPRGKYHDAVQFIRIVQEEFVSIFESEVMSAMTLVEDIQYQTLLQRYIDHVVAFLRREKLHNPKTGSHEEPSQNIMAEFEKIIGVQTDVEQHRQSVLNRIAAYKIENKSKAIDVRIIFHDMLRRIQEHYYLEKEKIIEANFKGMLKLGTDEENNLSDKERNLAKTTYEELERRFGYDHETARDCLRFLLQHRKSKKA